MKVISVKSVRIGDRHRKDFGDLEGLAESIRDQGLLQPIGITEERQLVFGERRLRACRDILGHKRIAARIVQVSSIVAGEYAENEIRKDFTPSERVAIARTLQAQIPERRGNPSIRQNFDELKGRTDDLIAKQAGFGNRQTYRDAARVVRTGTSKLVQAMDEGRIPISTAAILAHADAKQQDTLLDQDPRAIRQAARSLRHLRTVTSQPTSKHIPVNPVSLAGKNWTITTDSQPIACDAVIARPPFGTAKEPWKLDELKAFTEEWCSRWSSCGARYFAVFWNSAMLLEGRQWLDESLGGYRFQQVLVNVDQCSSVPSDTASFTRSWTPILIYRQIGCSRPARSGNAGLSLDSHVSMPGDNNAEVATMRWLVLGLTFTAEKVIALYCGSGDCGIATQELRRSFHGIELNESLCRQSAKVLQGTG